NFGQRTLTNVRFGKSDARWFERSVGSGAKRPLAKAEETEHLPSPVVMLFRRRSQQSGRRIQHSRRSRAPTRTPPERVVAQVKGWILGVPGDGGGSGRENLVRSGT